MTRMPRGPASCLPVHRVTWSASSYLPAHDCIPGLEGYMLLASILGHEGHMRLARIHSHEGYWPLPCCVPRPDSGLPLGAGQVLLPNLLGQVMCHVMGHVPGYVNRGVCLLPGVARVLRFVV